MPGSHPTMDWVPCKRKAAFRARWRVTTGMACAGDPMHYEFNLVKPASSYGLTGGTELGYRLYPAFWRRGLATEGARALITSAFERLHLDRVVATTMADNTGSCRVLEKCGLRRVRTFYYPDADLMPGAEHGDFV